MHWVSLFSLAAFCGISQSEGVHGQGAGNGLPEFLDDDLPLPVPTIKKIGSVLTYVFNSLEGGDAAVIRPIGPGSSPGSQSWVWQDVNSLDDEDEDDDDVDDIDDSDNGESECGGGCDEDVCHNNDCDNERELCAPQPIGHGPMPGSVLGCRRNHGPF